MQQPQPLSSNKRIKPFASRSCASMHRQHTAVLPPPPFPFTPKAQYSRLSCHRAAPPLGGGRMLAHVPFCACYPTLPPPSSPATKSLSENNVCFFRYQWHHAFPDYNKKARNWHAYPYMGNLRRTVGKGGAFDSRCGTTPGTGQGIQAKTGRRSQTDLRGPGLLCSHRICASYRNHLERFASGEIRRVGQFSSARAVPGVGQSRPFRRHVEDGTG